MANGALSSFISRTGFRADLRLMLIDLDDPGAAAVLTFFGIGGWDDSESFGRVIYCIDSVSIFF